MAHIYPKKTSRIAVVKSDELGVVDVVVAESLDEFDAAVWGGQLDGFIQEPLEEAIDQSGGVVTRINVEYMKFGEWFTMGEHTVNYEIVEHITEV